MAKRAGQDKVVTARTALLLEKCHSACAGLLRDTPTMKLRQLIFFQEVIRQDFNVSATARVLNTSQPGVSRQLQDLAGELGVDLFRYRGKRLVGLTPAGAEIAALTAEVVRAVNRIEEIADAFAAGEQGEVVVVATRHAAAARLRGALALRTAMAPRIAVRVCEEEPGVAADKLRSGEASIGLLTEPSERHPDLLYFPLEEWELLLVVPRDHPVARSSGVSLETIARYRCCSYEGSARSRQVVEERFRAAGMRSPVTVSLGSSEEILDYVAAGVGIGIVGSSAFVPTQHPQLRGVDVSHLFPKLTTVLVLPRRVRLSKEVYRLVHLLDSTLTRARIDTARADP